MKTKTKNAATDNGWIKLHRNLLDWEWYSDIKVCRVFLHLLLTANFKDGNWNTTWPVLKQRVNLPGVECFVALFNVNPINEIEKDVKKNQKICENGG